MFKDNPAMRNGVTESELAEKATGARVTASDVEGAIVGENYFNMGAAATALGQPASQGMGLLTICTLTLWNGWVVTGKSACADPANYNEAIGRRLAKNDAVNQIWPLLGFDLKSELANEQELVSRLAPAQQGWSTYIGGKALHATPLSRGAYNAMRGWTIPADENPLDDGYVVEYEDGYISWSPKEVFERAYRPVKVAVPQAQAKVTEKAEEVSKPEVIGRVTRVKEDDDQTGYMIKVKMGGEQYGCYRMVDPEELSHLGEVAVVQDLLYGMVQMEVPATKLEETWQDRARRELKVLEESAAKLFAFTRTDEFSDLPREDRHDLFQQEHHMQGYIFHLKSRLRRHGN